MTKANEEEDRVLLFHNPKTNVMTAAVVNGELRFEQDLPAGCQFWTPDELAAHFKRFVAPALKTRMLKAKRERDGVEPLGKFQYFCPFCGTSLAKDQNQLGHGPHEHCGFSGHLHTIQEWRAIAKRLKKELHKVAESANEHDKAKIAAAEEKRIRKAEKRVKLILPEGLSQDD